MKKYSIVFLCVVIMTLSACGNTVPGYSVLQDKTITEIEKELNGKKIDDIIDLWGTVDEQWMTEDDGEFPVKYGYLWISEDEATAIILYADQDGIVVDVATCKDVAGKSTAQIIHAANEE